MNADVVDDNQKSAKRGVSKALPTRLMQPPVRIQQLQLNALYVALRLVESLQGFATQTDALACSSQDFFATPADGSSQRKLMIEILAHMLFKGLQAKGQLYKETKTSWMAVKNPNVPAPVRRGRKGPVAAEPPGLGLAPLPESTKAHTGIELFVLKTFDLVSKCPLKSFDGLVVQLLSEVGCTCARLVQADGEVTDIEAWSDQVRMLPWGPYFRGNGNQVCPADKFVPLMTKMMLSFGKDDPSSGQERSREANHGIVGDAGPNYDNHDEDGNIPPPAAPAPLPVAVMVCDGSIVHGTWWAINGFSTAVSKKGAGAPHCFLSDQTRGCQNA
jgi:hypothetical protein